MHSFEHRLQTTIFEGIVTLEVLSPSGGYEPVCEITTTTTGYYCREHGLTSVPGETIDTFARNILNLISPFHKTKPADFTLELFQ
jgi:hypothetical protein